MTSKLFYVRGTSLQTVTSLCETMIHRTDVVLLLSIVWTEILLFGSCFSVIDYFVGSADCSV